MTGTSTPSPESVQSSGHIAITRAAQWLADQNPPPTPAAVVVAKRFGLSPSDAAEAVLLAGKFSVVRRAFS